MNNKFSRYLFLIVVFFTTFVSCNESAFDGDDKTSINPTPNPVVFSKEGGTQIITTTRGAKLSGTYQNTIGVDFTKLDSAELADMDQGLLICGSWYKVSRIDSHHFKVKVPTNETSTKRNTKIELEDGNRSDTLIIEQEP